MATTLVGIFDDFQQAQKAVRELTQAGINHGDINIARNEPAGQGYTTYGGARDKDFTNGNSIGGSVSNFFESLFGTDIDEDDRGVYAESVRRGSVLVTVNSDEQTLDRAADILNKSGAVNVDQRAAQYRASGYQKFDAKAPLYNAEQTQNEYKTYADQQNEVTLPIIEEQINVGKRVVQRGGVRVHTRVTERPVEETVSLREEHVNVERRPVDREFTDADRVTLNEGDFTVTTRSEEAVVGKQAHVVEEVVIGKNVTEREETVRDTVRRTDVEVEETNVDVDRQRGQSGR